MNSDEAIEDAQRQIEESIEDAQRQTEQVLEDAQRHIEEAIEEAQQQMEQVLEETAERHRETVSEAWKLQAESKAMRAYELYKAGLYDESIKLSLDVISQDPGNIQGYMFAAWSFAITGQGAKAREMLEKQISLLKTSDYRDFGQSALKVLKDILDTPDNKDLMETFFEVSREFKYFPSALLDELLKRSLYDTARYLYSIHKNDHYIEALAYDIEISNKSGNKTNTEKLEKYLEQLPHTKRMNVLGEYEGLKGGRFSDTTMNVLQEKIRERYREWVPDIKKEFLETASKRAKEYGKEQWGWYDWASEWWFGILITGGLPVLVRFLIKPSKIRNFETKLLASMREVEQDSLIRAGLMEK